MSNLINKTKAALSGSSTSGHTTTSHTTGHTTTGNTTTDNPISSNVGPHSSATANKLDPRVDSDADNRNNPGSRVGGYGDAQTTSGYSAGHSSTTTGHHATGGHSGAHGTSGLGTTTTGTGSTNVGPHSSNVANKLDPRVDSDADHRNNPASNVGGTTATTTGHHGHHGHHGGTAPTHHAVTTGGGAVGGATHSNYGATTGTTAQHGHNSALLNKVDPRVKNDSQGRAL